MTSTPEFPPPPAGQPFASAPPPAPPPPQPPAPAGPPLGAPPPPGGAAVAGPGPGQAAPGQAEPAPQGPLADLVEQATAEPAPDTQNDRLRDGVNRCPRCGSTEVQLRPANGTLICLFCRHEWSEARVEEQFGLGDGLADLTGTVIASGATDIDRGLGEIITLKCSGCGAEVVVNVAQQLQARCHWCRHVLTINEQIPNGAVPDALLPFHLTHAQAVEKIRQFANKRRLFAHSRFKSEFTPENVLGVYLPYMVVDANASSDVVGQGEIETRRYTRGSGDDKKTYYDADVYWIHRHVDFVVDDLTVESSADRANLDVRSNTNNIINAILPFDTKNAVAWNAAYLTGFTSEKRDQDVSAITPRVEDQLMSIARSQVEGSVGRYGRGVRWEQERLDLHGTRWVSMYLPVWLYSYYHVEGGRGMVHYIAVNARTGETMGSIPLAKGKLFLAAATVGTFVEALVIAFLVATA